MFRKEALEKLSSPEQLDQLLKVTSPKGWLALISLGVLIGALVIWSILGSIPVTVNGEGILIRGDAVQLIDAPQAVRVSMLAVKAGDNMQTNQLIANLASDAGNVE